MMIDMTQALRIPLSINVFLAFYNVEVLGKYFLEQPLQTIGSSSTAFLMLLVGRNMVIR